MISLTRNPLQLPSGCYQISCRFDRDAYSDADFDRLGVALPQNLHRAVAKRKAEYLAGRYCARLALREMGKDDRPSIGTGEHRAPLWPAGLVGSITHSQGFASAAIAASNHWRGIGIDSELLIEEKTANNVISHILVDAESYDANRSLVTGPHHYLTLIFSAKESIFKCLYPQVKCYFDFRDAQIFLDPDRPGTFQFELLKDLSTEFGHGYSGSGRYMIEQNFVHTAVLLANQF